MLCFNVSFFLSSSILTRRSPVSTLFPYTTLFRSLNVPLFVNVVVPSPLMMPLAAVKVALVSFLILAEPVVAMVLPSHMFVHHTAGFHPPPRFLLLLLLDNVPLLVRLTGRLPPVQS